MPQTERISMIYSGQLMETGPAEPLLQKPYHPYTEALLNTSLYRQAEFTATHQVYQRSQGLSYSDSICRLVAAWDHVVPML